MSVEQIAGQYQATPQTFGDGQTILVQVDEKGRIIVAGASGGTPIPVAGGPNYEAVAAGQSNQVLGPTGAVGDILDGILIVPATTSPGAVTISDGNDTPITIFTGGAGSVIALIPFFVPVGARCLNAGWKVTTGANVSVLGVGRFT
jgi:hypothetical protein